MRYEEFIKEAREFGFEHPNLLYVVAHHIASTYQDYIDIINVASEEEHPKLDIVGYTYKGKTYYVLTEEQCVQVLVAYRNILIKVAKIEIPTKYLDYMDFKQYSFDHFNTLDDIFEEVIEMDLDLDKVILPKYHLAICSQ